MNPIEVTVSVENIAPENGQGVAPIWFSLHDGSFDFFDEGKPASAAIEVMAEDGITGDPQDRIPPDFLTDFFAAGANPALFPSPENTIAGQFASSSAGQNGGYQDLVFFDRRQDPYFGVQLPGETASTTFVLNADPNQNRFFSYAGMLFPTNDGFIGNDAPQAIELLDAAGNFIGADFIVYGRDVWDSGTEVNDEDPTNVPYDLENSFNSVDENGVVSRHPGLNPAGTGGIVDFEFNGDRIAENADFSAPDYQIARIRIQAVDPSPDLSLEQVFNESYYLETNAEAAEAVANGEFASGLEHFQAVGLEQGLRFTPLIDLDYYNRVANPDLSNLSNSEALNHLLEVGIEEGRIFSQFVDLEFYKEANPELVDLSNSEALLHLRDTGLDAGLQFSSFVDLEEYRSFSPELSDLSLSETFTHLATFFLPEEEGRIRLPMNSSLEILDELQIITPEMQTGSAETILTYSKSENKVTLELDIDGLPYRETFTRPEDVSTPFNQQPVTVEDAKWQVWMVGGFGAEETNIWYDGATGDLIGSEFDIFEELPTDSSPIDVNGDGVLDTALLLPTTQAIGSPIFEGNPDGTAQVQFEYTYDQLLDERGTAGVYASVVPYNLNRPEEVGIYYTEGGLPLSEAMTWDDIVENIRNGNLFNITLSVEPDPKPTYLDSRPNTMEGWNTLYPTLSPDGIVFDTTTNSYRFPEPTELTTHANDPWPARQAVTEAETEQVFGTLEEDVFDAADPSDDFDGNRDKLFTGAGADFVDASQASAPLFTSTAGSNRILSGTGNDEVLAGRRDRVSGGVGDDILDASVGSGNNRLYSSDGDDELFAGVGDRLFGGYGDDLLDATTGAGDNRLYGQAGDDTFFLGSGDRFLGGDGDDAFFVTDGGDNLITGGEGADAFWIATGELLTATNIISDFELDEDVIGVAGLGAASAEDLDFSQVGDDAMISFSGFDLAVLLNTDASNLQTNGTFAFA